MERYSGDTPLYCYPSCTVECGEMLILRRSFEDQSLLLEGERGERERATESESSPHLSSAQLSTQQQEREKRQERREIDPHSSALSSQQQQASTRHPSVLLETQVDSEPVILSITAQDTERRGKIFHSRPPGKALQKYNAGAEELEIASDRVEPSRGRSLGRA